MTILHLPPALVAPLLGAALLSGCAAPGPAAQADCSGFAGSYRDRGDPSGESLAKLLLGRVVAKGTVVHIDATDGSLQVTAGPARATLDRTAFVCAADEIRLAHQDTSNLHAPPLIDQTRTTSYVLQGGRGRDLVLATSSQTTTRPYGVSLKGPLQLESTTTWRREAP